MLLQMATYLVDVSGRDLNNVLAVSSWVVSAGRRQLLGDDAGPAPAGLTICRAQEISLPPLIEKRISGIEALKEGESDDLRIRVFRIVLFATVTQFGSYWDDRLLKVTSDPLGRQSSKESVVLDFDRELEYIQSYLEEGLKREDFLEDMEERLRKVLLEAVVPEIQDASIEIKKDFKDIDKKMDLRFDQVMNELRLLRNSK